MVLRVNLTHLPSKFNLVVITCITSKFHWLQNLGSMVNIICLTSKKKNLLATNSVYNNNNRKNPIAVWTPFHSSSSLLGV